MTSPGYLSRKKHRSADDSSSDFTQPRSNGGRDIGELTQDFEVVDRGHWSNNPIQSLISDFRAQSACSGFHNRLHVHRLDFTMVCDGQAWKSFRGIDGGELLLLVVVIVKRPFEIRSLPRLRLRPHFPLLVQFHDCDGDWNMSAVPLIKPQLTNAIVAESDRGIAKHVAGATESRPMTPVLSHRLKHDKSILALVVSANCIFAGTEGGEILVIDVFPRSQSLLTSRPGV